MNLGSSCPSSLSITLCHSPHCQSHYVTPLLTVNHSMFLFSSLSIFHSPSNPLLSVIHNGSLPSSLLVTPDPFPPHCQSTQEPPLFTVNQCRYLPSPCHCQSHKFIHLITVSHTRSLPSPLSITPVSSPPFSLSFRICFSPPHCQSLQVPPLLIVHHPGVPILTSLLSITLVPLALPHCHSLQFLTLLTVNHFASLSSSLSTSKSSPHCQSQWVTPNINQHVFLPSSLSISPIPPIASSLSIIHGFLSSALHCQSFRIPPLLAVNHPGLLPSSLSINPGPSPTFLTVNHPSSLPSSLSITLCSSSPHWQSPWVTPLTFSLSITSSP